MESRTSRCQGGSKSTSVSKLSMCSVRVGEDGAQLWDWQGVEPNKIKGSDWQGD